MSESTRWPVEAIALLATPGLVETLLGMEERDGRASLAQLRAAGIADPLATLRTLAAGGHVAGPGSFDYVATEAGVFSLTYSGRGLARTLRELINLGRPLISPTSRRLPRWHLRRLGLFRRNGRSSRATIR